MSLELPPSLRHVRSLTFDLMGTCADWHTSIVEAMESQPKLESSSIYDLPYSPKIGEQAFSKPSLIHSIVGNRVQISIQYIE